MEHLMYIPPPPLKGRPLPESLTVAILTCSHKIHRECLRSLINSGTKTCPYCRAPINNSNDWFSFQEEVDDECIVNNSLSASHSITKLVNDMELVGFNTIGFIKPTLRRYNLRERIHELSKWLGERTGQRQDEIVMNMDQCEDLIRKIETQLRRTLELNSDNCFLNSTMAEVEFIAHGQADVLITSAANTKREILSDYGIITLRTLALVSQTHDIQCELHKAQNEIRMRNGENYIKHYQGLHLLTAEILLGKFNHHPWTTQDRLNSLSTYLRNNEW